jgi:ribonuclease HI
VESIEVRTDSRLLVAHMRGDAPVRSEQIALVADQIRALTPRFALLRYRWVPETENGAAHSLVQQALRIR